MGWGRMLLQDKFGLQMDIEHLRSEVLRLRASQLDARIAERKAASANLAQMQGKPVGSAAAGPPADAVRELADVRNELDEVKLYLTAVVRMLVGAGVVTREELAKIVAAVDASDGAVDGKYRGPISP